ILLNGDITCISNSCSGELVTYLNNILVNEHIPGTTTLDVLNVSEHNYCPTQESWAYCEGRQNDFENILNQGAAVISILSTTGGPESFGDWYWCSDNRGPLPHPEISFNLNNKNTGMPFLIAPNCTQGAVQLSNFECTTRKLMVYDNGGIIGAIAPTQGSEQYANGYVLNKFNDLIFQDNTPTYGEIFKILKDELANNFPNLEYYYNSLTYFGDPSLVPSIYKHRSGNISSSSIWSGNFVISGILGVLANANLTILPGSNLFFENDGQLYVYGPLNAVGTSSNKITFNQVSNTWGKLRFFNSIAASSILDNVIIKNGTGINCFNGANITIQNSLIDHCTEGIYFYNSQPSIVNNQIIEPVQNGINGDASGMNIEILNNTITKTGANPQYHNYQGIILGNSTNGYIAHNDISGFAWGIYIGGGSNAYCTDFASSSFYPNNRFKDHIIGMGAGWGAFIMAGLHSLSRYNSIYNNSGYDVLSYNNSTIYAEFDWWGIDGAQSYVDGTSYLRISFPLSSDPWEEIQQGENKLTIKNSFPTEGGGFNPDSSILVGIYLELQGRILAAVLHYKQMISDEIYPGFALRRLVAIKNRYQIQNIREYLEILLNGNQTYKPVVMNLFAGILLNEEKYALAMLLYNKLINDYPNTYYSVNALFEKFFAALNYKNNRDLAGQLLQELETLNLEDEEYLMRLQIAQNLFNEGGGEYLGKSNNTNSENINTDLPKEYALLGNYPNPFNPSTNISYSLPYISSVELVIYDIMGREIKTFYNASQPSGYQTITWDGKNENGNSVASGIYLYRISIKSLENNEVFVKSSKLMMLK
ncbi:MAG: C25 family cysteine peptidase, partial [Ignavibacteriaceae bacterium]|nr:C25 family cysteine peptidase [Ignavibacteriaceae bacterium]